jgi:hypothetical protein
MKRDTQAQWKQGRFIRRSVIRHLKQQARLISCPFASICQGGKHEPDIATMR